MGQDDVDEIHRLAGLATPMALRVAVTLGLPDRLHPDRLHSDRLHPDQLHPDQLHPDQLHPDQLLPDRLPGDDSPSAGELAAELDVAPDALAILLDHLVTLGVLERTGTGYRTTAFGAHLRRDADNNLTNLLHLDHAGGRAELAFVELAHSVRTGEAAYPVRYGRDFYPDLDHHPHLRESFDRQMTRRFRAHVPRIVAAVDWSRFGTLVDVGGGEGGLLAAILTAHPAVRGHLVDLAPTADRARATFTAHGLEDRAQATAGSFFDPLPAGGDAYLLFDILHNWDDDHAHRILDRCVEAARPDGRVLVIEAAGGVRAHSESDLAMLVIFGGRERTVDEFRALAAPHGLVLDGVTDLTANRCLLDFRLGDR